MLALCLAGVACAEPRGGLEHFAGALPLTVRPAKESRSLFVEALVTGAVAEPFVLTAGGQHVELVPGHRGWYRFDLPPWTEVTLARGPGAGTLAVRDVIALHTGLPDGVVDRAVEQVTVDAMDGDQAILRDDVCGGGRFAVPAGWIATRAPALLPAVVPPSRALTVRRGWAGLYETVPLKDRASDEWMDGPALTIALRDCPLDNVVDRVVDGHRAAYLSADGRVRFVTAGSSPGEDGAPALCSTEELAERGGAHARRVLAGLDPGWVDTVARAFLKRVPVRPLAAGDRLAVDLATRRPDHGDDPQLTVKARTGAGWTIAGPGRTWSLPAGLAPAGTKVGARLELRRLLRPLR